MTTLHMIGLAIAALGVLGGLGTGAFLLIGGVAAPLALGGVIQALRGLWAFLTSPVGKMVLVAVLAVGMFLGGDVHGRRSERALCEARIQASIEANRKFDKQLSDEQHAKAEQQQAEAQQRVSAAEQRVADYEQKFKSCDVGNAADWLNDDAGGLPTQPGRTITKPPKPPRRP